MCLRNMNRILIITGGAVNLTFAKNYIESNDIWKIIAVDGALKYANELKITPDILVGDFDTIDENILKLYDGREDIETIRLVPEKDYTDTHTAILKAIDMSPDEIVILGGIGSRIDHSISNIQLLQIPLNEQIPAYIINENNKIYLIDRDLDVDRDKQFGAYVSLIPFGGNVTGVTLYGFKYPLSDYTFDVQKSISLGVSNEVVEKNAKICMKSGVLLIVEAKD